MAQHRQITLRNVKGSALTYVEMDRNLSSFFHSASLSGTDLLLHYTGSSVLGAPYTPTSVTVPLNPLLATITQLTVAGNNVGDIQYRIGPTTLGADSSFKWDTVNYKLGVGVGSPVATLDVMQLDEANPSRIRITTKDITTSNQTAALELYLGNTFLGSFGKTGPRADIYTIVGNGARSAFTTIGTTNVVQTNSTGVGIFATPKFGQALTVRGVIGVGSDTGPSQGQIGNIIVGTQTKVASAHLPPSSTQVGLLIESPFYTVGGNTGGHVVIGINKTGNTANDSFSVIAGTSGVYSLPIITAKADRKVGINNENPVQALDIVGSTTMTANINVGGTATIVNVADSLGANSKVLTVNGSGLVQYATNLMPKGGIIMWSGSPTALPTGWALCDGTGSVNGSPIPDLRERFIVGAGGDAQGVSTKNYATAQFDAQYRQWIGAPITTGQNANAHALPTLGLANGVYNVVTTGTYYLEGNVVKAGLGGFSIPSEHFFVYQKTGANPYYLIYSVTLYDYILVRGTFAGTGVISNFQLATSGTGTTLGHYFQRILLGSNGQTNKRGVGDYSRDINGVWIEGKRPDHSGFYYYDTLGYNVGDRGGVNEVRLEVAQMPSHAHLMTQGNIGGNQQGTPYIYASGDDATQLIDPRTYAAPPTDPTGGGLPHENRPPYYALAFIIYTGV